MKPKQIVEHFSNYEKQWTQNGSSGEESVIIAWWERDMWADMPDDVHDDISQLITENMK
jgi:hypothetical protein